MDPEDPGRSASALVELGRAEEAIDHYPEQSAPAFLVLGRYEELLERFPAMPRTNEARIAALLALGRTNEAEAFLVHPTDGWDQVPAQLYLHPETMMESNHPNAGRDANIARELVTLHALLAGNTSVAEETLEQAQGIRSPDFWWLRLVCGKNGCLGSV